MEEPGLRQLLRLHLKLRGPVVEACKTVLNLAQLRKLSANNFRMLPPDLAILNELLALLLQDKRTLFLFPGKTRELFD